MIQELRSIIVHMDYDNVLMQPRSIIVSEGN
jgi:hypothetical protein